MGNLVVGLCTRALWYVTLAGTYQFEQSYVDYVSSMLLTLKAIANSFIEKNTLAYDSAMFWIAADCLRCKHVNIFSSALDLLEIYLLDPALFSKVEINDKSDHSKFTKNIFWKYHQPWGDTFTGCLPFILNVSLKFKKVEKLIRILNLLVQLGFPTLVFC